MPNNHNDKNAPAAQLDPAGTDAPSPDSRDGARKRRDPNEPAAVVGLGASAGGIAPLQQFFEEMPPDSGLAFVVVMHLSPEHESNLAAVIQQKTRMPVMQLNEPVRVRSNHVYVIPPNKQLAFEDSMLTLVEPQQIQGRRVTIDLFLRTLAQSYGQRSVSVILSGTDADGVIGLKHIRAQGGVTIAQDPNEAEHDSMPLSAISTGMVDWVLPVAEMPARLVDFVKNEQLMELPPEVPEAEEPDAKDQSAPGGETISEVTRDIKDESAVANVLGHLRAATGHDFSHYKRATVLRRIARRLQVNSIENVPDYLQFVRNHPMETRALLADLLIGVTHFFRDQESFRALEANVPQLFAAKSGNDQIRVWVIGCATGEEAYSIAMLFCEHADRLGNPPRIQIFATDLDDQAIHDARDGLYPPTIEADVTQERLRRFFNRDQGRYRVKKGLREKVLFASHNVLGDAPFSRVDLVTCRNLLIYLNTQAQELIFDIAHFALRPGGLLFIGGSETAGNVNALFSPIDSKHRLYVRRAVPRPAWKIPLPPSRAHRPIGIATTISRPDLPPLMPVGVKEAAADTVGAAYSGQERRATLFGELHLKLLEQYGPPSVVVNENHEIIHLSENAGRYLQFSGGEPSADILKVVHPALRIELRTALFRTTQQETTRGRPQPVKIGGETEMISVHVRKARETDAEKGFYLITFEKQPEAAVAAPSPEPDLPADVARDLEIEVQTLKQQLATTVENYEAANEDLKASNEELQAVNEEMRSATEELETSKEELQSVNEELVTVNAELKSSVEDLSRSNTDLSNLMAATAIGTIFLDRQLRIQRFTPSAQKIFNLLPADTGRPLSDITHKLHYDGLMEDAHKVLDELVPIEKEIKMAEDGWFVTRLAPYRTSDDRIAGVVVTFIDITRRKKAENELRESERKLRRAFEIETVGVLFFATDGRITYANPAFLKMSGYGERDVEQGRLRWDTLTAPEFIERSRQAFEEFKSTGKMTTYEKQYICKDGSRFWGLFSGTKIDENLGVKFVLDISRRKQIEEALRASEERFRQFADNSADTLWIVNAKTRQLEYLSPAFERMWGEPRDAIMQDLGRWLELIHPEDRGQVEPTLDQLLEGRTAVRDYRIVRPDTGKIRWLRDVGFAIRDTGGQIVRIAGIAQDITGDKERERAMREAEERYQLLVEGTPDYAMFLLDPDNRITYWSAGAEKMFGWTAKEAVGQSGRLIFTEEDQARGAVEKEIAIATQEQRAPDQRWHRRKDGSRLWADGVMRRIARPDGTIHGFAKICRDATAERRAEDELRHARDQLEQRVLERTADLMATNNELERTITQREQLERELLEISERERRRIGQDLHDVVCQELTATALFLKSTSNKTREPAAAKILSEAAEIVNRNVAIARDLARGFQPTVLASGGLPAALRTLCKDADERKDISCTLKLPRAIRIRDEIIGLNLFRIAQEAIRNAISHSDGNEIEVCIERERDLIRLVVQDNGKGFRPKKSSKGLGINIMKYRANVLGGTFAIHSLKKGGTRVVCEVPVKK